MGFINKYFKYSHLGKEKKKKFLCKVIERTVEHSFRTNETIVLYFGEANSFNDLQLIIFNPSGSASKI